MRRAVLALAALLCGISFSQAQYNPRPRSPDFELFILALSWSPTFCETIGNARGDEQCDAQRPHAFVLHGLWPQYVRGYPSDCGGPRVPDRTISNMLDIMPSRGLVIHEWRTHGTCSGLAPQAFFDTARRAFQSIRIPERFSAGRAIPSVEISDVARAFLDSNPGLSSDMFSITCKNGMLEEVRICLSKTLQPRRCAEPNRQACGAGSVSVPGRS